MTHIPHCEWHEGLNPLAVQPSAQRPPDATLIPKSCPEGTGRNAPHSEGVQPLEPIRLFSIGLTVLLGVACGAFALPRVPTDDHRAGNPKSKIQNPKSALPLDFPIRVLPVLTKAGCNTGTCHGAAIGRGGFRLSLLGYDPESDYQRITREFEGRRIQPDAPDESLLLRKPTLQIVHEGGLRFRRDSDTYRTLRAWIAAGAPYGSADRRVTRLDVTPADVLLPAPKATQPLRVTAHFSDGTKEDVTPLALYTVSDDAVATVSAGGLATVQARGLTTVMVRYLGQVAAARIGAPYSAVRTSPAAFPAQNFIDTTVLQELNRLGLPPSPLSEDAEFLRRVYLDVIGTLPTEEEARTFLQPPPSPDKRTRLLDTLLQRPEFTDLWTLRLADLLLINSKRLGQAPARAYHAWLREQVAKNTPFDRLVETLLLSQGNVMQNGAANFYRIASDPRDTGEYVSRTLLGVRVQCARCHNHPFDRWSQDDYHRFAALFARVRFDGGRIVLNDRGEVPHPKTGKDVSPAVLGGGKVADTAPPDRRTVLAAWITSRDNRMLSEAIVNRIWKHLMGRGLIEPVDDVRVTNPPSNPTLLRALADDFVKHDYDLRRLIRTIAASRTYQLSSRTDAVNRYDDRFFSHAYLKPLTAHVLADAVAQTTGVPNRFPEQPEATRALQLVDSETPSYTLDVFGRCRRETGCENETAFGGGLPQALHLINGTTLNDRLRGGVLDRLLTEKRSDREIVETLYLRAFSRLPDTREAAHWQALLKAAPDRREACEDLLWALLNAKEFAFNH